MTGRDERPIRRRVRLEEFEARERARLRGTGAERRGAGDGGRGGRRPPPRRPAGPPPRKSATVRLGSPKIRLRAAMILLAFIFSLLAGRLVQLQTGSGQAYVAKALDPSEHVITLPATRGQILDANGHALAGTVDAEDVVADPTQVAQNAANPAKGQPAQTPALIAAALAPLVAPPAPPAPTPTATATPTPSAGATTTPTPTPTPTVAQDPVAAERALLTSKLSDSHTRYVVLAKQVSPDTWERIKALGFIGIYGQRDSKRLYAPNNLAANVLGYVNSSGAGSGGIEQEFNKLLAGKDGKASYEAAAGEQVPTADMNEIPPLAGSSVVTTINSDIQWVAQQAIDATVKTSKASSGTVVVMNPRTGQILALATSPSFDPSRITDASQLGNRAFSEVYEPGSIAKIITMSAAIQQGVVTPATRLVVPGGIHRADRIFHDDTEHGTEDLTVDGVLAQSSNIGAIMVADQFPPAQRDSILYHYLTAFGLGQPTGVGFPGESPGILATPSHWSGSQRYTIPFGQGLALNAVQATSVFATIANGGVRVEPNLVKGTLDPSGHFTAAKAPTQTQVVSAPTARQVSDMMESVVSEEGTAPMAQIPGYRVAGKTGTANRYDQATGGYSGYTASFAGFAPADDPQLVVSVVVQNPIGAHFGGMLGGPVFKQVMSFALQTLKIPPTGTAPPDLPTTW